MTIDKTDADTIVYKFDTGRERLIQTRLIRSST